MVNSNFFLSFSEHKRATTAAGTRSIIRKTKSSLFSYEIITYPRPKIRKRKDDDITTMAENKLTSMESRRLHSSQKETIKRITVFSGESNENQQRSSKTTRRHDQPEQPAKPKTTNPVFIKALCNNTPQTALIDTGSALSMIHATKEHTPIRIDA